MWLRGEPGDVLPRTNVISSNLTVSSRYKAVSLLAGAITVQTVACCRYILRNPLVNLQSPASIPASKKEAAGIFIVNVFIMKVFIMHVFIMNY